MADRSYLDWPFFEAHHRRFAAELGQFAAAKVATAGHDEDADGAALGFVALLGRAGTLAYTVPAPFGGAFETLDVRTICLAREILAYHDGLADFAFVMQGLGSGPITLFGTEAQKQAYLPAVALGERVAALAMSEADAGSDVANMKTRAVADGDHWVLNGEKTWISNGGIADQYTVFAVTDPAAGPKGVSCFIVEAQDPGFAVTERIQVMAPHPLGTLRFQDCRIPADRLIGEVGQGFRIAMSNLDIFRSSVGAAGLGFARRALDEAWPGPGNGSCSARSWPNSRSRSRSSATWRPRSTPRR